MQRLRAEVLNAKNLVEQTWDQEGEELMALEEQKTDVYDLLQINKEEFAAEKKEMKQINDHQAERIWTMQRELSALVEE